MLSHCVSLKSFREVEVTASGFEGGGGGEAINESVKKGRDPVAENGDTTAARCLVEPSAPSC